LKSLPLVLLATFLLATTCVAGEPRIAEIRPADGELVTAGKVVLDERLDGAASLRVDGQSEQVDLPVDPSKRNRPASVGGVALTWDAVTTTDPPPAGTDVELVIPAAALVDVAELQAAGDYVQGFEWPASDMIVQDSVAPRLDTVCLQGNRLEIQLSEEPDLAQVDQVVVVDGLALTWTLGTDRYTLLSESLPAGSHVLSVLAGVALDLNGLGLATGYGETFEVQVEPINEVLFDGPRPKHLADSAVGIRYGFHGRPVDAETGFVYVRNRYYDPDLGRFVSTDPEEHGDSPSPYQFALNNPVNFSDPTGRVAETYWDALSLTWGLNSLVTDLKEGNYGMAVLDAFGVLVDAVAVATPFVPGGVGVALKACRAAAIIDMAQAVDQGIGAATSANAAYQSFEQGDVGAGLFNAGMAVLGARGAVSNVRAAGRRGCLFNCFGEGTLVLTEDGERPIEEIREGDLVWAWNEETGESELAEVIRVYERETLEVYTLHVGVGETLETTDEHPFWVVGRGWVEVEDLQVGDILRTYEGQELRLVAVERQERVLRVYNFEVRGLHTYFVGDASILVHNCSRKPHRLGAREPVVTDELLLNSKIPRGTAPSRVPDFSDDQAAFRHYAKHSKGVVIGKNGKLTVKPGGADLPEFTSLAEYRQAARRFFSGPGDGLQQGVRANGDIVRFNPKTGHFGVMSQDGVIRTFFRPGNPVAYFASQF